MRLETYVTQVEQLDLNRLRQPSLGMRVNTRYRHKLHQRYMQKEVQGMYLCRSLYTLYLHACQVSVTVGDSGLCVVVLVLGISSAN